MIRFNVAVTLRRDECPLFRMVGSMPASTFCVVSIWGERACAVWRSIMLVTAERDGYFGAESATFQNRTISDLFLSKKQGNFSDKDSAHKEQITLKKTYSNDSAEGTPSNAKGLAARSRVDARPLSRTGGGFPKNDRRQ